MNTCAIIYNGYSKVTAMLNQVKAVERALKNKGLAVSLITTDNLITELQNGKVCAFTGVVDFAVFLDKDVYISHMLERAGLKLFNSAAAIEACDDKMKTYIALSGSGVNLPDTLSAPLNYVGVESNFYLHAEKLFGYPMIVKEVYGSMGSGVHLVKSRKELHELDAKLIHVPHLYQKFTGMVGFDIRVITIGGKVVGAMERYNGTDFRSNIALGGVGRACAPDAELISSAEKVAACLGLDYCGTDFLLSDGKYFVCEVNSNAFFEEFSSVTGIDVAAAYADYIVDSFYK